MKLASGWAWFKKITSKLTDVQLFCEIPQASSHLHTGLPLNTSPQHPAFELDRAQAFWNSLLTLVSLVLRWSFKLCGVRRACALLMLPLVWVVFNCAQALDYPSKPIRWVVPTAPGAGTDFTARKFALIASEALHQSVIVDNRSGGSGMIGLDIIAASPADGYTLGFISVSQFIDGILTQKFAFDASKDFTPISLLASTPLVIVVNSNSAFKNTHDLIAYAKSHPNELSYSSGGSGGLTHLAMEVFLSQAGIKATHIPYKGSGPALVDLLAARVQLTFSTPPAVIQHIKADHLRALGLATKARSSLMPDVPALAEEGLPGVVISTWYGLIGPAHMNSEIVQKISQSILQSSLSKTVQDAMLSSGIDAQVSSPEDFAKLLSFEKTQWLDVVRKIDFKRDR